jgi:aspartyl-tRNA(Asn)/glutamyl-tRNA(Gln) amidotransferase subunit B
LENQLKEIMDQMLATGQDPKNIIKEKGFDTETFDENKLSDIIQNVLNANPDAVEKYKSGKTSVIGFLLGQVMKET